MKKKGKICDKCFVNVDWFKPVVGFCYVCLEEFRSFENISKLNGKKIMCLWNDPCFSLIEKDISSGLGPDDYFKLEG